MNGEIMVGYVLEIRLGRLHLEVLLNVTLESFGQKR